MSNYRLRTIVLLVCLLGVLAAGAAAQEQNLLTNGGFEAGFATLAGEQPRAIATGWSPWNSPRTADMPSFQNATPKYVAASQANGLGIVPRTRTGGEAQIYYSFFETHDGGIYQQVTGVNPGTELRFSIYAWVWSTTFDDPSLSEDPGDVAVRVGIDPTGGTDATSSNVVYSTPFVAYDTFRQYSVIATAQSSTITVFVRSTVGAPVQSSYIYLDDAALSPTTTTVIATTTPTRVPPTATHTATNTPSATFTAVLASSTPTITVAPSNTPAGNTPSATANAVAIASDTPAGNAQSATATHTFTPVVVASDTPAASNTPVPATITSAPIVVASDTPNPLDATPTREGDTATSAPVASATQLAIGGALSSLPGRVFHTVRAGDTAQYLVQLFGSGLEAFITVNGLDASGTLRVGQVVVIPVPLANPAVPTSPAFVVITATRQAGSQPVFTPVPPPSSVIAQSYSVQRGDTLATIATRFNTTITVLVQLNSLANPNRLSIGQTLFVPASGGTGGPILAQPTATPQNFSFINPFPSGSSNTPATGGPQTTYVVQRGDSLYRIASIYSVSVNALAEANRITNLARIFPGQTLVIPR